MNIKNYLFLSVFTGLAVTVTASPQSGTWISSNSTVHGGDSVASPLKWELPANAQGVLKLDSSSSLHANLRYVEWLSFDFRISGEGFQNVKFLAKGHVGSLRRYKIHEWDVAIQTTELDVWHRRDFKLDTPSWFPWDKDDGMVEDTFMEFVGLANRAGVTIEFRNIRFFEPGFSLKPDFELPITWPRLSYNEAGDAVYTIEYQLLNTTGRPASFEARLHSEHGAFEVNIEPKQLDLDNAAVGAVTVTAVLPKETDLKPLYAEALQLDFFQKDSWDEAIRWEGVLVAPLPEGYRRQVLLSQTNLDYLREQYLAQGVSFAKELRIEKDLAEADQILEIAFTAIPRAKSHPKNRIPSIPGTKSPLKPSNEMPRIVDEATGLNEFGTPLADTFWREYLDHGGMVEALAIAYLTTGEKKYAEKAGELFELYGKQYSQLNWFSGFDTPWGKSSPILASSRVAFSSTYGTNRFFKHHSRLLSAIAEAGVLDEAAMQSIYEGFILPSATEMIKFPASISNMTDTTNHNLLLQGIAFNDATLVYNALYGDAGLVNRVTDIAPDGFSSEGRPLNYHYAAMTEYVKSLIFLKNTGIDLPVDLSALPQALIMPFERANLAGYVPNAGDSGRWSMARRTPQAATMSRLFPENEFMPKISNFSDFYDRVHQQRLGLIQEKGDLTEFITKESIHFPDGGMVFLREGQTVDEQVMVSLDYGMNPFHGAYDRNQITLSAFGLMFSHGTGSAYNMGRGGMTFGEPAEALKTFVGVSSIGHNLVIVNQQNQVLTAGELIELEIKGERQIAASRLTGHYEGVVHERAVLLEQGIVLVLDRLSSEETADFDFVYHNFGTWGQRPEGKPLPSDALGTTANYDQLVDVEQLPSGDSLALEWDLTKQGKEESPVFLNLHQAVSQPAEFYLAYTGMNNPNTKTGYDRTPSMISRVKGNSVTFATVLEPNRGESKVQSVQLSSDGVASVKLAGGGVIELATGEVFK